MRCKQCKEKIQEKEAVWSWPFYFCWKECRYDYQKNVPAIQTKNKKAWRVAYFTPETKAQILIRDKQCVIEWCTEAISDYHHVFFWAEAQYDSGRNDADRGVWLCKEHHHEIHHGIKWIWKDLNNECKEYLWNIK